MPCADPLTVAHAASSPNRSYSLVISGPCAGARKDLELFDCHARTGGQGGRKNYEPPRIQAPSCARLTLTVRRRPAEVPGFPWSVPRVVLRVTSLSVRAFLVTARVCSLGSSLWAVGVAPVSNGQRCYNPCRWSTVYRARNRPGGWTGPPRRARLTNGLPNLPRVPGNRAGEMLIQRGRSRQREIAEPPPRRWGKGDGVRGRLCHWPAARQPGRRRLPPQRTPARRGHRPGPPASHEPAGRSWSHP